MRARRNGVVPAQPGNAALAAATAARTSAALASGTVPPTSPVAGLNTGSLRPLVPATWRPPMKCWISVAIELSP